MSINDPEKRTKNPDIAETTHDLKALHAQPAVTPDKEHRDAPRFSLGQKIGAAVAATIVLGGSAFGISRAVGGETERDARSPESSAPAHNGEGDIETELSPIQQQRAEMDYSVESDYFIADEFYENNPVNPDGPTGYSDPTEYVNQTVVQDVVTDLLNNMTSALETGNEDAVRATYAQVSPNDFGSMQTEVDILHEQSKLKQGFIAEYPDYPISSKVLQTIDGVSPDPADKDKASVDFTMLNTQYGNYKEGEEPVAFTTIESWTWDIERLPVSNLSKASETTMWVITNSASLSVESVE